jgi:hypothetical protein
MDIGVFLVGTLEKIKIVLVSVILGLVIRASPEES